jgi:hypothetical protein
LNPGRSYFDVSKGLTASREKNLLYKYC